MRFITDAMASLTMSRVMVCREVEGPLLVDGPGSKKREVEAPLLVDGPAEEGKSNKLLVKNRVNASENN